MEKHFPTHHFGVTKLYMLIFSTVLRKPCCKQVKAWLLRQNWFWSWEKLTIYIYKIAQFFHNHIGNSESHNSSAITNYQLLKYTKRMLDNSASTRDSSEEEAKGNRSRHRRRCRCRWHRNRYRIWIFKWQLENDLNFYKWDKGRTNGKKGVNMISKLLCIHNR